MAKIEINDILEELMNENKRLVNDLLFANKCINVLLQFKRYLLQIHSIETNNELNTINEEFIGLFVDNNDYKYCTDSQLIVRRDDRSSVEEVLEDNEKTGVKREPKANRMSDRTAKNIKNRYKLKKNINKIEFKKVETKTNKGIKHRYRWSCDQPDC